MRHFLQICLGTLLIFTAFVSAAEAIDEKATVRVALLDMSSLMPTGMMGYGMMGPGMMSLGQGTMNPGMGGYGMMGPGMMMGQGMMSIHIDKPTVKSGTVLFDVTNWSRSVLHEMLIVSVDNQTAPLPYDYAQAQVPEEQVKLLGEAEDLQPNASKMLEVALDPGSYLLVCNVPGHYAVGMVVPFSVAP